MKSFDEVYGWLTELSDDREEGRFHHIPFYAFQRLTQSGFYGWAKSQYTIITAHSGVGKTHLTKYLAVINTYFFCKKYNLEFEMIYVAMEESEDDFSNSILSYLMGRLGFRMSAADLKFSATKEQLKALKEVETIYTDMRKYIKVIDDVSNPTGIYKAFRDMVYKDCTIVQAPKESGSGTYTKIASFNKPHKFHFLVADHYSLLEPESIGEEKADLWNTMGTFSKKWINKMMMKRLRGTIIMVQQQESSSESKIFDNRGKVIGEKLEPSKSNLANNKETQREAQLVIGLFAPSHYDLPEHRGIPIGPYKDHIRFMKILKDRWYGKVNARVPLFFDGAITKFKEIPRLEEIGRDEEGHKKFVKKNLNQK